MNRKYSRANQSINAPLVGWNCHTIPRHRADSGCSRYSQDLLLKPPLQDKAGSTLSDFTSELCLHEGAEDTETTGHCSQWATGFEIERFGRF